MKDLPTTGPEGLVLAGVSARANPHDWLLIREDKPPWRAALGSLADDAVVGTSSVRREAQLLDLRPGTHGPRAYAATSRRASGSCVTAATTRSSLAAARNRASRARPLRPGRERVARPRIRAGARPGRAGLPVPRIRRRRHPQAPRPAPPPAKRPRAPTSSAPSSGAWTAAANCPSARTVPTTSAATTSRSGFRQNPRRPRCCARA